MTDRTYADMTYYFKIPRLLPLASSRDLRFVAAAKPSIVDSLVHSSSIMVGLRVRVFFGCTVRQSENFPYIGQSYMEEAMYLLLSTIQVVKIILSLCNVQLIIHLHSVMT